MALPTQTTSLSLSLSQTLFLNPVITSPLPRNRDFQIKIRVTSHSPTSTTAISANLIQVDKSQLTDVVKDIATFLYDRRDRIAEARAQKGGWEGWLQVELALSLLRTNGMKYDILREQMIYPGTERVDIWAQPTAGQGGIPFIGIELKVESEYQVGVNKTLQDRLKTDILKCNNGPKAAFRVGPGTRLWAVGITSLEADLEAYKAIAIATGQLICYCPLVVDKDHGIRNIFVIWWGKEFRQ